MKILIAPNAYKGFLSALEASDIFFSVLASYFPGNNMVIYPISDGGDGFLDCLTYHFNLNRNFIDMQDISGKKRSIPYLAEDSSTAIIELAEISGIKHLSRSQLVPRHLALDHLGFLIRELYSMGYTHIKLGLGGSATNDCGIGILRGMGFRFLDCNKADITYLYDTLELLSKVEYIIPAGKKDVVFSLFCDVDNKLLGSKGCTYSFGRQKMINERSFKIWDSAIKHYLDTIARCTAGLLHDRKYFGAAGGAGVSLYYYFSSTFTSGSSVFLNRRFKRLFMESDIIISGEGIFDETSLNKKAAGELVMLSKKHGRSLILIVGKASHRIESDNIRIFKNKKEVKTRNDAIKELSNSLNRAILELLRDAE